MKNIYFVQVGFEFDGSVYLPYSVGTIIAYCRNNPTIKNEYDFADIIFRREKLADALDKLSDPAIVAFSCNVWNMEYNKTLAGLVKERYPQCITVFGGHSIDEKSTLLQDEKAIDILMFGEGEVTFESLLLNLDDGLFRVPNIAYKESGIVKRTERKYCTSLENHPSPYLDGVFDKILKENEGTDFLSVLETNRGCPYSCTYCDWSVGRKVRFFPEEKVLSEIKWLSDNKIAYCFCADSNFGMFERDVEFARVLADTKRRTGFPEVFRPCYEKNSDERVFEICSTLNSVGMDKGATMAYQTLSETALENIGRKNLTMEHFSSLMKKYNEAGIPTYSELILGLPGETKESFCKGICKLFENGQHNSVSVYHCEVLPNSVLSESYYIEKHKIETIKVAFNHIHSAPKKNEEVQEYSLLVRSTATLSREDWVYANLFSVCVQSFHSLGLLRYLAIYLYTQKNISYYDFYRKLLDYILKGKGRLNLLWNSFKEKYENSFAGDWNYYNEKFGDVTWFFEEGAFLEIVDNYEECFEELEGFIKSFGISDEVLDELMLYQRMIVRKPYEKEKEALLSFDFHRFFTGIIKGEEVVLEREVNTIKVTPRTIYKELPAFAKETVWFGRRRGAAIYSGTEVEIEKK